jgi:Tfp pilus assembly protein PilV
MQETAIAKAFCRRFYNPITLRKKRPKRGCDGFSLVEAVFACALVAVFFIGIFGLNSQCLLFANSSKELMSAGQSLQARMEQLRACNWATVTTSTSVQTLFTPAVSGATNLGAVTQVVTIYKYPPPANPTPTPIQLTRVSNGSANVTPTINTTNATLTNGDMVQINLQWSWQSAPGGRQRSMAISTIYGKNTQQ